MHSCFFGSEITELVYVVFCVVTAVYKFYFRRAINGTSNIWRPVFVNLLKPTDYVMHQQFNIQQLYVLPTLYFYVLYLSENKQRLGPLTA